MQSSINAINKAMFPVYTGINRRLGLLVGLNQNVPCIYRDKPCDRAIMLGTSNEILFKYFGLSTTEISTKRFFLNVHLTRGRSRKPNFEESEAIWKKWLELVKDNPLLNEVDDFNRLDAFMIITESISLFFSPNNQNVDSEQEYLSLTSIIKEIESN